MSEGRDAAELRIALPLGSWDLTLVTGDHVWLAAHAYSEENGELVFSVLMDGAPAFYVDVFRITAALVSNVDGG